MRKKILSFLVALCLVLPSAFFMAGCKDKTDPTTPATPPPAHTHTYNDCQVCSCGDYLGVELTLDETAEPISVPANSKQVYRVAVEEGHAYRKAQTNYSGSNFTFYNNEFEELDLALTAGNPFIPDYSGYLYLVYNAELATVNSSITVYHIIDDYGFSGDVYLGTTIEKSENIDVVLEEGAVAYYRFEVLNNNDKYYLNLLNLETTTFKVYYINGLTGTKRNMEEATDSILPRSSDPSDAKVMPASFDDYYYIVVTANDVTDGFFFLGYIPED